MSSTATTSIKRSPSSTPTLGTPPDTPRVAAEKGVVSDLSTREPQIKKELERWENIVFSFGMEDNNRRSSSQEQAGGRQPTNNQNPSHQLPEGQIHPTIGGVPSYSVPWDIHTFFPAAQYGQQSPYDMLGLGAMNSLPPNPHTGPHPVPDPFGNPWDLSLPSGVPTQSHIQPLTPAEIAQYHALVARGAGTYSLPSPNAQLTQAPEAPSSSASTSQVSPTRGRSTSSAGRSPGRSQPGGSAVSEEEVQAITEDKRRRNTAASARFRVKKKQRTMELERAVVELEGRADELEKEAVELRRENGWLKEMVILKGRKAMETAQAGRSNAGASGSGSQDKPEDNDKSSDDVDTDKGKAKET
ncbi:Regulatory protein cys-3 [Rhizoctonia solani AG-1 IB]|uniref:Regulatory protein cys-3 n=1 Tax=Thanatephorus cucumeris (strain AG1-IB / isolate 7/3/14) TaxID=1108050 RepID=M5BZ72_THACB|nr:Regulatory protein cys-3 [Rhizoctonia solani AG-1 IB]